MNKASCLSLLSNTVHIDRILTQLRAAENVILDEDLVRVSPLLRKHVTPNGSYFQSPRHRTVATIELDLV